MTTAFANPIGGFLAFVLLILVVAMAFAAVGAVGVIPSIHATEKHGSDADVARTCLHDKGATLFMNPTTNRYGVVCNTEDGWGIVILDQANNEITAFLKNKMKSFDQVLQYMRNSGYDIIH